MTECCAACQYSYGLEKLDYSKGGCTHTGMDGYVCMAFADEGLACWMIGVDINAEICECFKAKEVCNADHS